VCEEAGVAWRVADAAEAVRRVDQLLAETDLAVVGQKAVELIARHQGAARQMSKFVESVH